MANLPYKPRPLFWLGETKRDLSAFPAVTKRRMGFGLRQVQNGETPPNATPLKGFGASVYEIKENENKNTYRVVYVVKLRKAVYVLDAFMKKSKSGKATPKEIKERIETRLKYAKDIDSK